MKKPLEFIYFSFHFRCLFSNLWHCDDALRHPTVLPRSRHRTVPWFGRHVLGRNTMSHTWRLVQLRFVLFPSQPAPTRASQQFSWRSRGVFFNGFFCNRCRLRHHDNSVPSGHLLLHHHCVDSVLLDKHFYPTAWPSVAALRWVCFWQRIASKLVCELILYFNSRARRQLVELGKLLWGLRKHFCQRENEE